MCRDDWHVTFLSVLGMFADHVTYVVSIKA